MSKILEIKNLMFGYSHQKLFKGLTMSCEEGKITTIVGNNKSGKTTLIKLIAGLLDNKNAIIAKYSYVDVTRTHENSRFFGMAPSNIENCFLFDTVYKELAFPLENLNIEVSQIEKKMIQIAKEFEITKMLDKKIEDLTNSERQELLIVIALLHDPKVLLLDNSFSMMNPKTKQKYFTKLRKRSETENLTVVMTTTNLEEIIDSDYTYVLNEGDIIMEGIPLSILKEEKILNRIGLELPFMIDLSLKLEFYQLLNEEITDIDRMVDTLWK